MQKFVSQSDYPKDAKSLLEARYQAFVDARLDFILESHHPDTRSQVDADAIRNWSENSRWLGLKIEEVTPHTDHTHIRFTVRYERNHEIINHTEIAEFRMHEGRWYYYDSEFPNPETVRRQGAKIGRNDACPCGSGRKYKKCHGQAA